MRFNTTDHIPPSCMREKKKERMKKGQTPAVRPHMGPCGRNARFVRDWLGGFYGIFTWCVHRTIQTVLPPPGGGFPFSQAISVFECMFLMQLDARDRLLL